MNSRRTGSAANWITIPDLKTGQLTLSSFTIGERPADTTQPYNAENFLVQRNAEHRFKRDTPLRLMIYIYNAKGAPPNLEAHIQVIRDEKAVFGYYNLKVEPGADNARGITYGAEVPLETLSPGRYVLQVTITNGPTEKQTARTGFIVE